MAIQVYNFNKFDGYAKVKDYPDYEFRIYFNGNSNTLATICSKLKDGNEYYLYNFIAGIEHLKNMKKEKVNWFDGISEIILTVEKITTEISRFISYALEYNVKVTLLPQEQWGEPIE